MPTEPQPPIDLAADPVQGDVPAASPEALALSWLPKSGEDRMLMTVSTIDADGFPRGRTVILTDYDGERFFFHTDALSAKVADVARDPRVSLTLAWPGFTRQLVVQGLAAPAPPDEIAAAFAARSPYLQQLAQQNTTAFAQLSRSERVAGWSAHAALHPHPPQPEGWTGFGVLPHRMLFWVSNPSAASRRVQYLRGEEGWHRSYLPG